MMRIRRWLGALVLLLAGSGALSAQDYADLDEFQARVWLDRGDEPVLQRGDRVRIYYRTSTDAYVAIFHIDTDGSVQLLHPQTPDDDHYVRGGRDYRLLFPQSPYWFVDEFPGKGYFFVVASPEPFDFTSFEYAPVGRGWDLTQVGRSVYQDPYVAIDDYVARLIPSWETTPYALDFIAYDVGETHEYPRFLCYDCHGFRAYSAWNPYTYACSSFRVVIWDDPYFYPAYRYRGTKVVFAQPPRGLARFEFKERARGEAWSPLTRTRQPPLRRSVEYSEPAVAAPAMPEFVPPRRRVVPSDQMRDDPSGRSARPSTARPSGAGVAPPRREVAPSEPSRPSERPTTALPGRTTVAPPSRPSTTGQDPRAPRTVDPRVGSPGPTTATPRSGERPVLQRRPSGRAGSGRTTIVRPPSGAGTGSSGRASPANRGRVVMPSRPSAGSPPRGESNRPPARATAPPSGSRPSARPSRPPPAAKPRPKPRPKPNGPGGSRPPARKPGGGRV